MLCNNFGPKGTLLHLPPGTQLVLGPPNEDLFDPKGTVIGPFFSSAQNNFHFFSLERVDSVTRTPCKNQWTWSFSVGRFLLAEARMTLFTPSTPRSVIKNSETNTCIFFMITAWKTKTSAEIFGGPFRIGASFTRAFATIVTLWSSLILRTGSLPVLRERDRAEEERGGGVTLSGSFRSGIMLAPALCGSLARGFVVINSREYTLPRDQPGTQPICALNDHVRSGAVLEVVVTFRARFHCLENWRYQIWQNMCLTRLTFWKRKSWMTNALLEPIKTHHHAKTKLRSVHLSQLQRKIRLIEQFRQCLNRNRSHKVPLALIVSSVRQQRDRLSR